MSEMVPERRFRLPLVPLSAGLASSLLYASIFLSFAFLVPQQIAYGRSGRRAGLLASGAALAVLLPVQAVRLVNAGALSIANLVLGLLPPAILLGALALMNAAFWDGRFAPFRALAAALACALAVLPGIIAISSDGAFAESLASGLSAALAPLVERAGAVAGEGFDQATLAALFDPIAVAQTSIGILRDSFAALLLALLGGSWWIGNRAAGLGSSGRAKAPALEELRVPYAFVWPFLACWALLLAALLFKAPRAASAATWNIALCLSLVYAAQGLGIVTHYLKRWKMPKGLRALLVATIVVAAASSPAGAAIVVAIPLLGVTEVWIPYRNPKGVGA